MNYIPIVLFFILSIGTTYSQDTYQYSTPRQLDDGWKVSSLHEQQVDTTRLYQFFNHLQRENHKVHSMLVIKDNAIILEEYFNKYTIDQRQDLRSVTKSITSILMGIAIDQGFVESIDDPITKYLQKPKAQKNLDERKSKITIRHLLTMSTGLDCNDWDKQSKGQEDKVYRKNDWLQYFLDLPVINDPGTVSNYCTMGQVLATEIVSQASGMSIDQFAKQYLFEPLQITNFNWGHTSSKEVIPSAKRLYMTPRDLAKIGQLILQNGTWNKQQIVSSEWINTSTSPKTKITGIDYGFLWWNFPFQVNQKVLIAKSASGNGGQYIYVIPELNLVAVFTGGAYNSPDGMLPFAVMKDVFLPMFVGME